LRDNKFARCYVSSLLARYRLLQTVSLSVVRCLLLVSYAEENNSFDISWTRNNIQSS